MFDVVVNELRERSRLLIGVAIGVAAVLLVGAVAIFGVGAWTVLNVRPPANATDPRIPITSYGYASVQVFDCVRQGPQCSEFEQSKEYLRMSNVHGGITYTPLAADGAFEAPVTVTFNSGTPDSEYITFGNAVTGGGLVNPRVLHETMFAQKDMTVATFTLPARANQTTLTQGTMTFMLTDQQMVLRSVTYEKMG